ncbi:hypothetical protein, partial [Klebsiella pneumoniae]|uniref:hypothetical protein n=1 Tax=Klebsiella pneumoniae TaxID=573 RepID=UPI003B5A0030
DRAIRDNQLQDNGENQNDILKEQEQARQQNAAQGRPEYSSKKKQNTGENPLNIQNQIETQKETAIQREERQPTGGSNVNDSTEAL